MVAAMNGTRYKLIVQAVIGEFKGQGAFVASRALWDTSSDNFASHSFKNVSVDSVHLGVTSRADCGWCITATPLLHCRCVRSVFGMSDGATVFRSWSDCLYVCSVHVVRYPRIAIRRCTLAVIDYVPAAFVIPVIWDA